MASVMVIQGRRLDESDMGMIRGLLDAHPDWHRTRLSRELCACWNWRNAQGQPKDMAARTLLLKLERAGHLRLPARRAPSPNGRRNRLVEPIAQPVEPIRGALRDLLPLRVNVVAPGSDDARLFNGVLGCDYFSAYHKYMTEFNITVQFCIAHLIRDIKFLTGLSDPATRAYGARLLAAVKAMFKVIHQGDQTDPLAFQRALEQARDRILEVALGDVPSRLDGSGKELKREAFNMAKRFRES